MKNYDCDIIIVVHLSYKNNLDTNGFENTNIIEIYPSSPLEIINGIGTINIKKDNIENNIENNIELGYRDVMVILAPMIINILKGRSIGELIEKIMIIIENLKLCLKCQKPMISVAFGI